MVDGIGPHSSPHSLHLYTGAASSDYLSRPRQDDLPSAPGRAYHAGGYLTAVQTVWRGSLVLATPKVPAETGVWKKGKRSRVEI